MDQTNHTDCLYGDYVDPESLELNVKLRERIKNGLRRKVYGILFAQLALTTALALAFTLNQSWGLWIVTRGQWIVYPSMIVAIASMIALTCVPGLSQKHPTNLWILFSLTLAEAVSISYICSATSLSGNVTTVVQALCLVCLITFALTLYAMQSSRDFTNMQGLLVVMATVMLGFGLFRLVFPYSSVFETIYAVLAAVMFSTFIVVDTQRLLGKGAMAFTEDDYVQISLTLYADIIGLFLNILQLLRERNES